MVTPSGGTPTADEKAEFRNASADFVATKRKASELGLGKNARDAKRHKRIPFMATYDWLVATQNAWLGARARGWEAFVPKVLLPWDADQDGARLEATAVGFVDEEQRQWTAASFLQQTMNVCVELWPDSFHRRSNDVWLALKDAGFSVWVVLAATCCNVGYGPWQACTFFQELLEQGDMLCHMLHVDDPVLSRLRPKICSDKGWHSVAETSKDARAAHIASLPVEAPFRVRGPHCSSSRFFSIWRAWKFWRRHHWTKALGLVHLSVAKGWCSHWDEMFAPAKPAMDVLVLAGLGPAMSSSDPLPAPPTSLTQARVHAKERLHALLKRSENALHATGRLLCEPDLYEHMSLVMNFTLPLYDEHCEQSATLKGVSSIREHLAALSNGAWLTPLQKMVQRLRNLEELEQAGFRCDFTDASKTKLQPNDAVVVVQDALAKSAWRLCVSVLAQRCYSMQVHHTSFPGLLAGLLSSDDAAAESTMTNWQIRWEAYAEARNMGMAELTRICARSSLNTRSMESAARVARASGWRHTGEVH